MDWSQREREREGDRERDGERGNLSEVVKDDAGSVVL